MCSPSLGPASGGAASGRHGNRLPGPSHPMTSRLRCEDCSGRGSYGPAPIRTHSYDAAARGPNLHDSSTRIGAIPDARGWPPPLA
jgi:hypothetical protein